MNDRVSKWGFLREDLESAQKAGIDVATGLHRTGLEEYLKVIFPDVDDWIHDRPIGVLNGVKRRIKPDYRSETLKLIIEFDGLLHYTDPENIVTDIERTRDYTKGGYKVVRIPYFIQLTNEVVKEMFGVEVSEPLFPEGVPSMAVSGRNTPAFLCTEGVRRMARELLMYPSQLEVNLKALRDEYSSECEVDLSGYKVLKSNLTTLDV
ncbi:MAG: DUF559 domain-containing protein [Duncaniella sp.]|nr:DUF559 domain-containing protein [Duncaniella sp.]